MILAVLLDGWGRPVPVVNQLPRRFDIGRVCVVVDRDMNQRRDAMSL